MASSILQFFDLQKLSFLFLFLSLMGLTPGITTAQINPDSGNILYVDQNVSGGTQTGDSWTNAIPELRDVLVWAQDWDGDADGALQIWVADGLYLPVAVVDDENVTVDEQEATFQLVDDVEIYGGFDGGESSLGSRDWESNLTILSGDIDENDNPFEPDTNSDNDSDTPSQTDHLNGNNSFHVISAIDTESTAFLDGFTITAGNAEASEDNEDGGGGMFSVNSSPSLSNLTFSGNSANNNNGGGMSNIDSSPTLTNVNFNGNSANNNNGGGIFSGSGSPSLINVTFTRNTADRGGGMHNSGPTNATLTDVTFSENSAVFGGGMYILNLSESTLTNVIFSGNSASYAGGGIYNISDNTTLTNVTIFGNSADAFGGGIYNEESNPTLINVIIWDNQSNSSSTSAYASIRNDNFSTPEISNSLIANSGGSGSWISAFGTDGGSNLDIDPLFTNSSDPDGADDLWGTADDGLALQSTSPAINAGDNAPFESGGTAEGVTTDIIGNDRIFDDDDDIVDMGAYEFQGNGGVISGTPSVVVSGNAGWRMMGVPVTGVTVEDLAGINLVQGISGLPQAVGDPNVYLWDVDESSPDYPDYNGSFVTPASGSTGLQPGTGFIWYMWGPEANPDLPESKTFPLTIELTGDEPAGDISLATLEADWHLVANPFIEDIHFDQLTDGTNPLGIAGSVWDPNEGAEGSYVLTTSVSMDNKLSVWQGAFIELTSQTEVVIPQSAKTTGATFLKDQQEPLAGQVEFLLEGSANGEHILDKAAILYFSERATPEWDGYDLSKLTPLSESWATVNLVGNRNGEFVLKSQHSLPYDFAGTEEIPVNIELQNTSGDFTLSWPVVHNLPQVDLWLLDRQTGTRYNLRQPGRIDVTMQGSAKKESLSEAESVLRLPQIEPMRLKQTAESRFVILINPEELAEELPTQVALDQNYPNPFNPATVIRYQLPVNSEVRLEVFDMIGRRVAALVNGQISAGTHIVTFDASGLSSVVHIYRLAAGNQLLTIKLTVIK